MMTTVSADQLFDGACQRQSFAKRRSPAHLHDQARDPARGRFLTEFTKQASQFLFAVLIYNLTSSQLGPLDMRMDPRTKLTAGKIVNEYGEEELTRLFRELGEEPAARRIASLIVKMRRTSPFRETLPLARAIEKLVGRHGRHHPATQVFQALRMEVNDELGALEEGLRVLTARLAPRGRIAVITFHSLEDRIVKNFFRDHSREWLDKPEWPEPQPNPDYDLELVTPKPVEPSDEEQRANPRSRSAKLRVAEKI